MRQTVALGLLSGGLAGAASALLLLWPEGLNTGIPTGLFLASLCAAVPLFVNRRPRRRSTGILPQATRR